jgi:hypothetical protein
MASWLPGDVVLTSFGVGVIVSCPTKSNEIETDMATFHSNHHVVMWRVPGKSIGSASTAYLQNDAVRLLRVAACYLYCT